MSKLTEKRQELGAAHQRMEQVLKEAGDNYDFGNVKVFGDELDNAGKVEKFRELNTQLTELTEECKRLELAEAGEAVTKIRAELDRPVTKASQPRSPEEQKSIGDRLISSEEYKAFKEDRARGLTIGFDDLGLKTLFQTSAGWAPESIRSGVVVPAATRPIQVLDLIPMGDTDQSSVVYMEETTRTHNAAETAEGAAYPEDAFELTERNSQVRKIPTSIPVTDEQLEDEAQVRSYLNQRLAFGVRQRLDGQVLNGDGVAPNLGGILNTAGIQTQALGTDPRFDAIHKAMTKVRVTGRAIPGAVVLNPLDWETIRLTRTADGIYILGNPSQAGPMSLFGLPVALGDVIAQGTGLVGDFQNFCALHDRRGLSIQVGYVNAQFTEGKQTIRADMRVAFTVYRPAAFCTVTGL